MAGLIAPVPVWEVFSPEWDACLKQPPKAMLYYRTTDARALKGPFLKWTPEDRDARIAALARIIPTKNCYSFGFTMQESEYERILKNCEQRKYRDSYYLLALAL